MPDVGFGYLTPKIRLDPDFAGSRSDIRPSLLYSDVHTLKNKAERLFSHSAVFPDKFPDISRFCSHPKLFNLRKINWDNSLSVTQHMMLHVVCAHGICQQVFRHQVRVQVQVLRLQVQVQVFKFVLEYNSSTSPKYYMSDYKSLHSVLVMICATLVNMHTDRRDRQLLTGYTQCFIICGPVAFDSIT